MAMLEQFTVKFDSEQYKELVELFKVAPNAIGAAIRARWMKRGKFIVAVMKPMMFGVVGPHSVGRLSDKLQPKDVKHLGDVFMVKKVKFQQMGQWGNFGGFMAIGFGSSRGGRKGAHPLANIFENSTGAERFRKAKTLSQLLRGGTKMGSTGRLKTTALISHAWNTVKPMVDLESDINYAIETWMNSKLARAEMAGAAQRGWMET